VLSEINIVGVIIIIMFCPWKAYFIPKGIENYECGTKSRTTLSLLVTSHFHINIADWIGEADSIKPLLFLYNNNDIIIAIIRIIIPIAVGRWYRYRGLKALSNSLLQECL